MAGNCRKEGNKQGGDVFSLYKTRTPKKFDVALEINGT
jgi:hypothetical protein